MNPSRSFVVRRRVPAAALAALLASAGLLAGCAPMRPMLYPNDKLQHSGQAEAQRDIDECIALAQQSGAGRDAAGTVAERTATGALVGAAGGLGVGVVTGNVGRGMATGAAGGASVGLVSGLLGSTQMDPVMRRWVEACLQERGYRVVGWQ